MLLTAPDVGLLLSEKDLRRAIAITRVIPVYKGLDLAFGAEDLVDLVAQLAGANAMNNDHGRKMVRKGQVEIFFEGLQLQGEDLEIVQRGRFIGQLFGVQVKLRPRGFQVLAGAGSLINAVAGTG